MTSTMAGSSSMMMILAIIRSAENISELRKGKANLRKALHLGLGANLPIQHHPSHVLVEFEDLLIGVTGLLDRECNEIGATPRTDPPDGIGPSKRLRAID